MSAVIFAANVSHAAKPVILADITAEELFANIGYEVDCSYWERTRDGKQLFAAQLPEEALITPKDDANIEVYAEPRQSKILEVVLYVQSAADTDAQLAIIARVVKALDENISADVEQSVRELLNADTQETIIKNCALTKELSGKTLIVRMTAVK